MAPPLDKVMHVAFHVDGIQILASGSMVGGKAGFKGLGLPANVADNTTAKRTFRALGDSGRITIPVSETLFAHVFGMVADRFGIAWMIIMPRPM